MSKSAAQNKILNTLSQTLPDNRPITAIQVVENVEKCPNGFVVISRTHDQDQDADLWRETSLLFRKPGRYLCLSKTEGLPDYVIEEICVISDKEPPPQGFSVLQRTADSEQKAWRKKQLCYRFANIKKTSKAVTDIIICSRMKHAPTGFTFAGEINGMILCFKIGNVSISGSNYENTNGSRVPPERPPKSYGLGNTSYPLLNDEDHDYERLLPSYVPKRPAPKPPVPILESGPSRPAPQPPVSRYNTLIVFNGLEGVPFIFNSKFIVGSSISDEVNLPVIKQRSIPQLKKDYDYDFRVERQT